MTWQCIVQCSHAGQCLFKAQSQSQAPSSRASALACVDFVIFCMLPVLHNISLALYQVHSIFVLCLHNTCLVPRRHNAALAQPRCMCREPNCENMQQLHDATAALTSTALKHDAHVLSRASQASETHSSPVNLRYVRQTSHVVSVLYRGIGYQIHSPHQAGLAHLQDFEEGAPDAAWQANHLQQRKQQVHAGLSARPISPNASCPCLSPP